MTHLQTVQYAVTAPNADTAKVLPAIVASNSRQCEESHVEDGYL